MKKYKVYTKEKGLVETNEYRDIDHLTWHRADGPAAVEYYANGNIRYEGYWIDNMLHRLDGPASIEYDNTGNITNEEYCINDEEYTKEQYNKELLKLKVQSL